MADLESLSKIKAVLFETFFMNLSQKSDVTTKIVLTLFSVFVIFSTTLTYSASDCREYNAQCTDVCTFG